MRRNLRGQAGESDRTWLDEQLAQNVSPVLKRLRQIQDQKVKRSPSEGSSYSEHQPSERRKAHGNVTSTLTWSGRRVTWTRGSSTVRNFTFDHPVLAATFAWFPSTAASKPPLKPTRAKDGKKPKDFPQLARALCVLSKRNLFVLLLSSGKQFDIPIAFEAANLKAAKIGVYIQRHPEAEDYRLRKLEEINSYAAQDRLPTVFHVSGLLQDVGGVYAVDQIRWHRDGSIQLEGSQSQFTDLEEEILFATSSTRPEEPPILVTRNHDSGLVRVYACSIADEEPERASPPPSSHRPLVSDFAEQARPGDASEHGPRLSSGIAESSADGQMEPNVQPPRKSARLERDRKMKYYGSVAGEDALDRSRRVSWLQGPQSRLGTSGMEDVLGSDHIPDIGNTESLAGLAEEVSRPPHPESMAAEESMIAGRSTLGRRQPASGRTSGRALPPRTRSGRQSSATSRFPSMDQSDLAEAANTPRESVPMSARFASDTSAKRVTLALPTSFESKLQAMSRSYAHVALLAQIASEPTQE